MWQYALKRLLMTLPTLFFVAVIVFVLIRLIPGDPVAIMLGDHGSDADIEALRRQLGLDQPVVVQFLVWLGNVVTGDLGVSIMTGVPVTRAIADGLEVTAMITVLSVIVAVLVAVPAGMLAAWRQNTATDFGIVFATILFLSVPGFWLGVMLIFLFAVVLGWLPIIGFVAPSQDFAGSLPYFIMPVMAVALADMAAITRMLRAQTLEVLRLDYVTHARAKGLSETVVLTRHVFKNAVGPGLTVIGLILGGLLGGAAVTETVFTLPGVGRLLVDAIYERDYPVLQGCMLFIALIYVVVNLVVDLLYMVFDPRVRL